MVPLKAHLHANARPEDDQGLVDPLLNISYATLHLKPTAAQQAELEKLLIEQQDERSPNYHRWLTPEEYADRFGLTPGDIAKIKTWLESEGLHVNDVARGRRWITFSGSAASIGRSFHTEIHHYTVDGKLHFANTVVPSVPEALADVVAGIEGLDDYYPVPASAREAGTPRREYTSGSHSHYLAPDDIATIYDVMPFYAAGLDGNGQTIAIVGNTTIDLADLRSFRTRFNLPSNDPKMMLVGPDPGVVEEDEAYLDLEWAGAMARRATLIFVYAKSVATAAQYAVDQRIAPVLSESFLTCEPAATQLTRAIAQQANAEGITWIASSGDGGAAGCDRQGRLPQASKGAAVGSPASIPEVTALGGTEFDEGNGTYWATTNANGASVLSYIPEKAWNDSFKDYMLASSTGGPSIFYPKPWWQSGPGVPNDNARDVPDISLTSSASHDGYIMYAGGGSYAQGGTSAAAPVFAGMLALINQYLVSRQVISQAGLGNINPTLYRLAQSAPGAFHDVVKGDNIVPCVQGTPSCMNGSFGYTAGPGYDLATGLGSIDVFKLATNWTSGTPTSTTVNATPATIPFNSGNVQLTAVVSASAAAPAGEVAFLLNDASLGTGTLASTAGSAMATLTVSGLKLPVGTNTITAVYSGSGSFNSSAGTTTVTVTAPAGASAVVASATPNPVYQHPVDSSGYGWSCTISLTNESAVATTLTKFSVGSTDYTSQIRNWFGTTTIPANGSIKAPLDWKNLNPPVDRIFTFSGVDASGATWTQQMSVSFLSRMLVQPSLLLITPQTVPADPAADASCRWPQPLVLEEQGGYGVRLTALASGDTDFSAQLQQIFGTTTIAPFGKLQGTLCWDATTAAGSKSLNLTGGLMEVTTRNTSTTASTTLQAPGSASQRISSSVSPAYVSLSAAGSGNASGSIQLSFSMGAPAWTAKVSPSNYTTNWLTVSPASGTGAAQLNVTASAAGLSNGVYSGTILIQTPNAAPQFASVPVSLVVGGSSSINIGGVTNAASYKTIFAPGMLMTIFGTNLAPAAEHAGSVPLPLTMQGVTATINGYSAPLLDVTPGQLNLQIPYETGAGTAILGVNNNGQVASFAFQVQPSAPGIFMTLDGASNLVPYATGKRGDILLAFITGEGDVAPALITGRTPTTTDVSKLPAPGLPVTLTVGGVPATINFIGIPNGLVGVTQVNFTVPANAPLGKQPVVVTAGPVASAPVMLNVTQ